MCMVAVPHSSHTGVSVLLYNMYFSYRSKGIFSSESSIRFKIVKYEQLTERYVSSTTEKMSNASSNEWMANVIKTSGLQKGSSPQPLVPST